MRLSNSNPLLITHEQRLGNISLGTWHNMLETNHYVTLLVLQGEIPGALKQPRAGRSTWANVEGKEQLSHCNLGYS